MLVAVYPLHKANPVQRIVVATYQAASGAGAAAMAELEQQTAEVLKGNKDVQAKALPQRIAFNLFPQVDVFLDNGYTKEEMKFVNESRKIMHHPTLMISATCVREACTERAQRVGEHRIRTANDPAEAQIR